MNIKVSVVLLSLIEFVCSNPLKVGGLQRPSSSMVVGNSYVQGYLNTDGTFVIRTSAGQPLLYPYLLGSGNGTSCVYVYIDGYVFTNNPNVVDGVYTLNLNDFGPVTQVEIGDTARSVWEIYDIYYNLSYQIVLSLFPRSPQSSQMVIETRVWNHTYTSSNIGVMYLLDTYINGNDSARIVTPYGFNNLCQEYYNDDIPWMWQAFEQDPWYTGSQIVAEGQILGIEEHPIPPAYFAIGNWPDMFLHARWDEYHPLVGTPYYDSAVLLRSNTLNIPPNGWLSAQTYYGVRSQDRHAGNRWETLGIEAYLYGYPEYICESPSTGYLPDPAPFTLIVGNFGTTAITIDSVRFVPPANFTPFIGTDLIQQLTPSSILAPGNYGIAYWEFSLGPSNGGTATIRTIIYACGQALTLDAELLLVPCGSGALDTISDRISELVIEPKIILPGSNDIRNNVAEFRFPEKGTGNWKIYIYDIHNRLVKEISPPNLNKWDGTDEQEKYVPTGSYVSLVQVGNEIKYKGIVRVVW